MTLSDLIREEIARRGPIPFRDFMERALYHPEHGYYTSGRARIGRSGDFITNVSAGPLFGALLARQFEEMWLRLDRPAPFTIVEQGAHDGQFAADVLSALATQNPTLRERLQYVIVEPTERARALQRQTLRSFGGIPQWVESVASLKQFVGVHFSNELLDSFPVHLVKWTGQEWVERRVTCDPDCFTLTDQPLSPGLDEHLALLPPVPAGYMTEVNLAASEWIEELATKLERGYVLAIDYGFSREEYYRADRTHGTLSAYLAHRRQSDPLGRPGEIDLTAHVDFTGLAEAAHRAGLRLDAFTDQHHFMVGWAPVHFAENQAHADLATFKTLMHPQFMGLAFKVICFAKGSPAGPSLTGFQHARDFLNDLRMAVPG